MKQKSQYNHYSSHLMRLLHSHCNRKKSKVTRIRKLYKVLNQLNGRLTQRNQKQIDHHIDRLMKISIQRILKRLMWRKKRTKRLITQKTWRVVQKRLNNQMTTRNKLTESLMNSWSWYLVSYRETLRKSRDLKKQILISLNINSPLIQKQSKSNHNRLSQ